MLDFMIIGLTLARRKMHRYNGSHWTIMGVPLCLYFRRSHVSAWRPATHALSG